MSKTIDYNSWLTMRGSDQQSGSAKNFNSDLYSDDLCRTAICAVPSVRTTAISGPIVTQPDANPFRTASPTSNTVPVTDHFGSMSLSMIMPITMMSVPMPMPIPHQWLAQELLVLAQVLLDLILLHRLAGRSWSLVMMPVCDQTSYKKC